MAIFGTQRDAKFLASINAELLNAIIDTEIEFFKLIVEESNSNIYGESTSKESSWPEQPRWFTKGSDFINIYNGLIKSGMKEENIFKILGSNWLKFMKKNFG